MSVPLRLLIIEDSSDDAQLMVRDIQRGGYDVQFERVETEAAVRAALEREEWDLILCDYTLPAFNAVRALELVRASGHDLPFMIVSGSIGEEMAVAALRGGANDFMLKGNLARLLPAIQRELKEAETRRQRRRAEAAARKAISFFETAIETANVIFLQLDTRGNVVRINSMAEEITGYQRAELVGRNWGETVVPRDRYPQPWREFDRIVKQGEKPGSYENPILTRSGEERYVLWRNNVLREDGAIVGMISFGVDITERKRAEAAVHDAETRYRLLVERIPAVTYVISGEPPYNTLYVSPQVEALLGFTPQEWLADPDLWEKQLHPGDRERVLLEDRASRLERRPFIGEYRIFARDGRVVWLHDETHHIAERGLAPFSQGIEFDITERKQAEQALRDAESRYRILIEHLPMIVYVNAQADMTQAIYVSPQLEAILGYTVEEWLRNPGLWQRTIHPDDRPFVMEKVEQATRTGQEFDAEYRMIARDGHIVWFRDQAAPLLDANGQLVQWQGLMVDITETKQREREWAAIAHLSQALRQLQSVKEIVPRLLDETLWLIDSDQGSVWLQHPVTRKIYMAEQRRWAADGLGVWSQSQEILKRVIDTGQPVVERDLRSDSLIPEEQQQLVPPGLGGACVPLTAAGKPVGAMFINVRRPREITAEELRVLGALADLGAYAIHRAQLFEETVKHLDRLAALRSIDMAISSSLDLKVILDVVLDKVTKELAVDAADILLLRPDSLMLEFGARKGFWTRSIESDLLAVGEGLPGRAILQREITHVEDLQRLNEPLRRGFLLTDEKFVSYYGVPLVAKGKVKGVLEIFNRSPLRQDSEWLQFLEALAGQTAIAIDSSSTFQELQRSKLELELAYDATIEGWSHALDLRDRETEGHTLRVTDMALKLARLMGMGEEELIQLRRGGLLHDIGKMGIPDSVLLKQGRLTDEEWAVMRTHPQLAHDMLAPIAYLRPALDVPYCHHERWDGEGYPRGLKGDEIPLAARIFSVVDVWDALRNDRPYRPGRSEEDVLKYIHDEGGKQFDPAVTEAFLNLITIESVKSSTH